MIRDFTDASLQDLKQQIRGVNQSESYANVNWEKDFNMGGLDVTTFTNVIKTRQEGMEQRNEQAVQKVEAIFTTANEVDAEYEAKLDAALQQVRAQRAYIQKLTQGILTGGSLHSPNFLSALRHAGVYRARDELRDGQLAYYYGLMKTEDGYDFAYIRRMFEQDAAKLPLAVYQALNDIFCGMALADKERLISLAYLELENVYENHGAGYGTYYVTLQISDVFGVMATLNFAGVKSGGIDWARLSDETDDLHGELMNTYLLQQILLDAHTLNLEFPVGAAIAPELRKEDLLPHFAKQYLDAHGLMPGEAKLLPEFPATAPPFVNVSLQQFDWKGEHNVTLAINTNEGANLYSANIYQYAKDTLPTTAYESTYVMNQFRLDAAEERSKIYHKVLTDLAFSGVTSLIPGGGMLGNTVTVIIGADELMHIDEKVSANNALADNHDALVLGGTLLHYMDVGMAMGVRSDGTVTVHMAGYDANKIDIAVRAYCNDAKVASEAWMGYTGVSVVGDALSANPTNPEFGEFTHWYTVGETNRKEVIKEYEKELLSALERHPIEGKEDIQYLTYEEIVLLEQYF